jgi:hypothetical protein
MSTSKKGRAFAGFFAGLFILTSSALTIGVIYQMVQDNNAKKSTTNTSQLNDAEKKALAQAQAQSKAKESTVNPGKLQGTALAGFTPVPSISSLQAQDTIPGMKVGGTRRLLIPASLAYGAQGTSGIPPNSDLVFDVTVTKIGK